MTAWARNHRTLLRRCRIAGLLWGGLWLLANAYSPATPTRAADEADPPKAVANAEEEDRGGKRQRVGHLLEIELPITGDSYESARRFVRRVLNKAEAEDYQPVLIFQFSVNRDQSEYGRGSDFGASADLARFLTSKEVSTAPTVAYVPVSIQGHAVLGVLACDQIIMGEEAEIGSAGIDEKTIDPSLRSIYREIASRRKNFPVEVALAMLDPAQEVLEVKTEFGTEYVSPEGLEKLRQEDKTIRGEPRVLIPAGQPGQFSGAEARQLRFINYLAASLRDVARALELESEAIQQDLTLSEEWVAVGVPIRGPLDGEKLRQAQRMIEKAISQRDVNFVCLWIESPGGDPAASMQLASFLSLDLDPGQVRTVAYVPAEARGDAALIALACDQLVIRPGAILGGPGAYDFSEEETRVAVETIRNRDGTWGNRSWSLIAAIVDRNLDVFEYTRQGDVEYFCEEEAEEFAKKFPAAEPWVKGKMVTRRGAPFRCRGDEALEYRLAYRVVDDFTALRKHYGVEDLDLAEPGWAEMLIEALASPAAAGLLLMIGFFAMYAELHSPGVGIGGFLATVCFLLFFWSRFLGGTAGWLEAILFVAGLSCLLLELFVIPGFGIFGLGGALLVLTSLILASQTFIVPRNQYQWEKTSYSMMMLVAAAGGGIAAMVLARRWLPSAPVFNRMFLEPPAGEEADTIRRREALVDFEDLPGTRGTTTTQLTPSGKARFGNRLVDVIADGELIERGTEILVVEVCGNRVLVRATDSTDSTDSADPL